MSSPVAQLLGSGEWFTVNIAGYLSQPRLLEGRLIASAESKVQPVYQVGDAFGYSSQDNQKVPEAFTFRWRAEGDKQAHERLIQVRSQLPHDVLRKLASRGSPPYSLKLNFRVQNGVAECVWALYGPEGSAKGNVREPLAEGIIGGHPTK
jgi:hypothetical protein